MRPIRVFDDSSDSSSSSDSEEPEVISSQQTVSTSPAASKTTMSPPLTLTVQKGRRKRFDSVSSAGSQSVLRRSARLMSREPSPVAQSPLPPSRLAFSPTLEEIQEVPVVQKKVAVKQKKTKSAKVQLDTSVARKRGERLEELLAEMNPKAMLKQKSTKRNGSGQTADDLFLIDTTGGNTSEDLVIPSSSENEKSKNKRSPASAVLYSQLDSGITKDLYVDFNPFKGEVSKDPKSRIVALKSDEINELMKKSQIVDGFEQSSTVLADRLKSKRQLKREKQAEKGKTKGHQWFNLPATELTEERRRDLEVLQLRDSLDPKRHYKSNDRVGLPKYFQVGTVLDSAADFYHSRMTKKERKATIVEELLADADFRRKQKRKYSEIQAEMHHSRKGAFRHTGKNKRIKKTKA